MNFSQAIRSAFSKYATFDGRARRAEYWYYNLLIALLNIGIVLLGVSGGEHMTGLVIGLQVIIGLGTFLPSLAVCARRLHDTDRSGWWMFVSLIPVVGLILLVWVCTRGTLGSNRFGDDPVQ
ncbi:DUF805 domain-containing protein [Caballeronia sp. ATUFL_M2_KS44]|uniref:DUF805 domain-containing protein n=1 Tax=Caballeronia sp. ATUFL_M2_KS44 TaxID=2921767 RepID=UPI00202771EE|nr:DUF805 domain-containing protein [Caballeronia sp. ATUFL_M2_KS44]